MSQTAAETVRVDTRRIFAILSVSNFIIGMGAFSLVGMIEPMADELGVSAAAVAGLLTVYAVAVAVSAPVLVALTGQIGRRRVLAAGLGLFALASALAALAPGIAELYPARVLAAVGAGLVTPVSLAIAAGLSAPERRGKALSAVFLGITLAQVAGVPVGAWLAYTYGWRPVFALVAALALPCLALVWMLVPAGLRFPPVSLKDLGRVLRDPLPLATVGFTVVFLASIYVVFTYLPLLMSDRMGFGREGIALALFLFGAAAPIGNLLGGLLADRLGSGHSLALICVGEIITLPLFALLPMPATAVFAFIFIWSLVGWAFSAPQQLRLVTLNPPLAPVLLSLHAASIYVGIAVGSGIASIAYSAAGLVILGPLGAAIMVAALGVLIWSERAAQRRRVGIA
jgi:predicted MFS family arabinose efflux permease